MIKDISDTLKNKCEELNFPLPFIHFEPGRSIVQNAACTLYTVGSVKKIEELNKIYVAVDGCLADNPQYALYKRVYDIVNFSANSRNSNDEKTVTVIGKCCENGDRLAENIALKTPLIGDVLCAKNTGAYTFVKSMNYNKMLRPAVLLLKSDGTIEIMIRRQNYKDLLTPELN
ncbi:MAG: hypothetical protein LBP36_00770 [Oscillospiraceae bacterium]|jgi:diaminopimelate decarboxylase|nr:hypothetical protein [Oscillospiraceae bacterium]